MTQNTIFHGIYGNDWSKTIEDGGITQTWNLSKKITQHIFWAKEFYTLKTRKFWLFSGKIYTDNKNFTFGNTLGSDQTAKMYPELAQLGTPYQPGHQARQIRQTQRTHKTNKNIWKCLWNIWDMVDGCLRPDQFLDYLTVIKIIKYALGEHDPGSAWKGVTII